MSKLFIAVMVLVAGGLLLTIQLGHSRAQGQPADEASIGSPGVEYVDGRILVRFEPGTAASVVAAAHRAAGGVVIDEIGDLGVQVVAVGAGRVPLALKAYTRNLNVRYAEPDFIVHATIACEPDGPGQGGQQQITNDDCSWRQWGLNNTGESYGAGTGTADSDIDAPEAWNLATGSGVTIASLDTGYDTTHVDLAGKVVATQDCTGEGIEDLYGHGTWTATIASALTNNGTGMAGAAPDADLMIVKVLNVNGSGSISQIACGVNYAANYAELGNRTVISLSLGTSFCPGGGPFNCNTLKSAVNDAWDKGAVLFASAGNSGDTSKHWPAAYDKVIAVAATDDDDNKASFSTSGNWVDVAAPGVSILGAFPDCDGGSSFTLRDSYGLDCNFDYGNGTSASSPLAAAVGALVWSADPTLSNEQVRGIVESTSDPVGSFVVHGRVNACAAVAAALGTSCGGSPPTPEPTATPTATPPSTATPTDAPTATPTATAEATAAATATATATPTPSGSATVSVSSISYATTGGRLSNRHLLVTAALLDGSDQPVGGVSVSINLLKPDGSLYGTRTDTTGTDGTVTFKFNSFSSAPSGCYTSEVTTAGPDWDSNTPPNEFCK